MSIVYPYLPQGRSFKYVPQDNEFMEEARRVARDISTDKIQSTSAVTVKDGIIIGVGGNQVLIKNKYFQKLHRRGLCTRKFLKIKSGTRYWMCPGCSPYDLHAEAQAIKDAKEKDNDTNGADLYHWGHWWCCKPCWDKMIEAGIKDVYLLEGSEKLFNQASSENVLGKQF